MKIKHIVWFDYVKDKLEWKHAIRTDEVREVFMNKPRFFRKEKGKIEGENVYNALGTTNAGRYLSIFFIYKKNGDALIISAREMNIKEKKRYAKK